MLRIATWNLAHRRNASPLVLKRQLEFIEAADCDIWLLAEVPYTFRTVMGPDSTVLSEPMDPTHKAFAGVWAKDGGVEAAQPVHAAAAHARVAGLRVCAGVLPWPGMALSDWPDRSNRSAVVHTAVERLRAGLADGGGDGGGDGDLVWGGAWHQALQGDEATPSPDREALVEALAALGLTVPTAPLPHTGDDGACSVDHIAIPSGWRVGAASRLAARDDEGRLCEHDAYVVEVDP